MGGEEGGLYSHSSCNSGISNSRETKAATERGGQEAHYRGFKEILGGEESGREEVLVSIRRAPVAPSLRPHEE